MSQALLVRNKGLYTSPNEFAAVPVGAMTTADNCVITTDDILESRRGNARQAQLPVSSDRAQRFTFFQNQQLAAWGTTKVGYFNGTTWVPFSGSYADPDPLLARRRFVQANSNLYWTSASGVWKLDTYNGTPVLAGMVKGLDMQVTLVAGTTLATANQVAYRSLWYKKDANLNITRGVPSGRAVATNTSGATKDMQVTVTIPSGVDSSFYCQVYRSAASGGAAVPPNDELQLVYEYQPVAGDLTAGTFTFTDTTPDNLRGLLIYTAPSLGGIVNGYERPPMAQDAALFGNVVVYANVKSKQRLTLNLLSASLMTNGNTVTIAGTVYTAAAAENTTTGAFALATLGTPSQNIADTAASLIRCINRSTSNTTVNAIYMSGANDTPGKILLEERGLGGAAFAVTSSAPAMTFNPTVPAAGTSVSSSNDQFQHYLAIAQPGQAEAVPLGNYIPVGSANYPIQRVLALRNTCFIFKPGEGIFTMTGKSSGEMQIVLFDSSAKLLAPDTLAVVNNQIWGLSDQGVVVITETGVQVVSRPIENLILDQFGLALNQVKYYSFGVGYETERQYQLWTVSSSGDTYATQCFVFNSFTKAFTRWPLSKTCGTVSPVDGKLYLGDALSNFTEVERKDRRYTDYADYQATFNLTSFSGLNVYIQNGTAGIEAGDVLYQSDSVHSVITSVQPGYVTVRDQLSSWTIASCQVLKSYQVTGEYAAITDGNPGTAKFFYECTLLFRNAQFWQAQVGFSTDVSGYFQDITLNGEKSGQWGLAPWGQFPWGGAARTRPKRTLVPLEKQRGSFIRVRFQLRQAWGQFKLEGLSLPIREVGSYGVAK